MWHGFLNPFVSIARLYDQMLNLLFLGGSQVKGISASSLDSGPTYKSDKI